MRGEEGITLLLQDMLRTVEKNLQVDNNEKPPDWIVVNSLKVLLISSSFLFFTFCCCTDIPKGILYKNIFLIIKIIRPNCAYTLTKINVLMF